MSITIKMYQKKWQIHIGNERWQFDTKKEFEETLKKIIDIKDKFGKLENYLE